MSITDGTIEFTQWWLEQVIPVLVRSHTLITHYLLTLEH